MSNTSFADKIRNWDLLNSNIKPEISTMPELQTYQAQLETLLTTAKSLDATQSGLRGQLQETTRLRLQTVQQGEELRSRLSAGLRAKFGATAETLLGYGVAPRRARKRRTKAPADPTTPVQPTPESTGAAKPLTSPAAHPATA